MTSSVQLKNKRFILKKFHIDHQWQKKYVSENLIATLVLMPKKSIEGFRYSAGTFKSISANINFSMFSLPVGALKHKSAADK